MNAPIRTSLALAAAAGTLAMASTASADLNRIILRPTTPIDVIGTGKNFDQTWNVINWDAKRDSGLGNAIQGIHDGINSVRSGVANAAGAIPGVNLNVVDPGVDANASINAFGRAYVAQQRMLRLQMLPASMGVHAEATATFSLTVSAAGVNLAASPSYKFDATYVEPVLAMNAPYFHASLLVRQPTSSGYTAAFDYTQATAIKDSRFYLADFSPTLPPLDLGFVHLKQSFSADFDVTAAYSLSTTGGNVDLSGRASSSFSSGGGDYFYPGGPILGVYSALLGATVLAGDNGGAAAFDARASISAAKRALSNGSLCGSASGSLSAKGVGKYNVFGYVAAATQAGTIGPFTGSKNGDGVNVSQSIVPTPTCISL
jgi:hypothetical protein